MAKVLKLQLQYQFFQWIFRTDFLQDWLVWQPCCLRDSQESSSIPQLKSINSSAFSFPYGPTFTSIHDYWKNHHFDYMDLCWLFNMISRFVIVFLPRSKHLLISWLQSWSAVILEPKKRKSVTASTFSHSICNEVMEPDTVFLVFWMFSFKTTFSLLQMATHSNTPAWRIPWTEETGKLQSMGSQRVRHN